MVSLTVVIVTLVAIFGALWMIIKFNKGEEMQKAYRDKHPHPHPHKGSR